MSVVQFQCPSCQAPLRLQNRALFVGRAFDCPDCHESLLIEADGSAGVKAKPLPPTRRPTRSVSTAPASASGVGPSPAVQAGRESAPTVSDVGVSLKPLMSAWDRLSRRPAALGWIVAALFAVILLIVVNSGRHQGRSESVSTVTAETPSAGSVSDNQSSPAEADEQNSKAVTESNPTIQEPDATKAVSKLEVPPLPDPPSDDKPAHVVEKPSTEEPKPAVPPAPAVLSPEAVEAKLQQKIVRFDQPKPVPFVKVLDTVEELAGVPIVWDLDRVDDEQLQKPVTLQLKQTTVGEILDTLLKQVGLERRTVEGRIELRPKTEAVPRP